MPPIEGISVEGANGWSGEIERSVEQVNAELVAAYKTIAERGGTVIAKEVLLTPIPRASLHRQDVHFIVDFPEPSPEQS
jgi:hypothetical protein